MICCAGVIELGLYALKDLEWEFFEEARVYSRFELSQETFIKIERTLACLILN